MVVWPNEERTMQEIPWTQSKAKKAGREQSSPFCVLSGVNPNQHMHWTAIREYIYACSVGVCICVCVCAGRHAPWCTCRNKKTTLGVGPCLPLCLRRVCELSLGSLGLCLPSWHRSLEAADVCPVYRTLRFPENANSGPHTAQHGFNHGAAPAP